MRIRLTVIAHPDTISSPPGDIVFDDSGGTIGRHPESDWVLPDPNHFVSGHHARIDCVEGAFVISDTSANGLFINDAESPLGKGNRARLNDGDHIGVGDYEIRVSVEAGEVAAPERSEYQFAELAGPSPAAEAPAAPPPPAAGATTELGIEDIIGPRPASAAGTGRPGPAPAAEPGSPVDRYYQPPQALPEDWDRAQSPATAADAPSGGPIPDDWDKTLRGDSVAAKAVPRPGGASRRASPTPPPPAAKPTPRSEPGRTAAGLEDFLAGAGIDPAACQSDSPAATLRQLGACWRAAMLGLIRILRTRAEIKNTFRMEMTRIQPQENNPLKFALNDDQALLSLVRPPVPGQLESLAAIEEAVQDLQAHQMAMLAGMRSAVREVLGRFEPGLLEEQIRQLGVLGSVLPAARKARLWEEYRRHYETIVRDSNERFDQLFGEAFAQAYEEQMRFLKRSGGSGPGD